MSRRQKSLRSAIKRLERKRREPELLKEKIIRETEQELLAQAVVESWKQTLSDPTIRTFFEEIILGARKKRT